MSKSDYLSLAGILSALCFSAALLLSFPAAAQNNECSMMCNGIDNQCYRSCAGSNDGLSPFGPAPGSGASRSSYGAIAISDSDKGALRWGKAYGYESRCPRGGRCGAILYGRGTAGLPGAALVLQCLRRPRDHERWQLVDGLARVARGRTPSNAGGVRAGR